MRPARHGFDDDADDERLLRSPPTPAALAWVAAATGSSVAAWRVLRGGTSSAMYAVDLDDAATTPLVLRCYVRPDLNVEEPWRAAQEAAALEVVAPVAVPTPALVAVDPDGDEVGVPALLMTRLPGGIEWDPVDPGPWLRGLAEVLPAVHAADPTGRAVGTYASYRQRSYEPPAWAGDRTVWERAVGVFHEPVPAGSQVFLHRDHHPGNVLWSGGRVSGVVDWQSACVGPPSVDVGHCRANLLRTAPHLAEPFTRLAEAATGEPYDRWADVACLIGMLDGLRDRPPPPPAQRALEHALAEAIADR